MIFWLEQNYLGINVKGLEEKFSRHFLATKVVPVASE